MGLIIRKGVDIEGFKRIVLSHRTRINKCRIGPEILDLALKGKNSAEIAEVLKAKGRGGLHPVSSSTISRWLRATSLFRSRARPGWAENEETTLTLKELLAAYEVEVVAGLEKIGTRFLSEIPRVIRRIRRKGPLGDMALREGRSDRRKRDFE